VLVVTRVGQPGVEAGPGFATAPTGVVPVSAGVRAPTALPTPSGETLLRDERLDEYLRAHQFARGGAAISAPSTAVRRVELTVPAQPER
jgi:sigma-E factor negative regulatory protein RseA